MKKLCETTVTWVEDTQRRHLLVFFNKLYFIEQVQAIEREILKTITL